MNNSQLIDAKAIYNTYPISTPSEECPFYVLNNTKLDVSTLCESSNYNQFLEIQVYNNKKDCGKNSLYISRISFLFQVAEEIS